MLDLLGRARPSIFAKYAAASIAIKTINQKIPERLYDKMVKNQFRTRRKPDKPEFYQDNRKRIGLQTVPNQMKDISSDLDQRWINLTCPHHNRRYLKSIYFNCDTTIL